MARLDGRQWGVYRAHRDSSFIQVFTSVIVQTFFAYRVYSCKSSLTFGEITSPDQHRSLHDSEPQYNVRATGGMSNYSSVVHSVNLAERKTEYVTILNL